jgi:lambda repressor-like predicted transcriptional regulator
MDRNRANFAALEKRAAKLDCTNAEARWLRIRQRMVQKTSWLDREGPAARRVLAECWARRAMASKGREEKIAWLVRARELDRRAPSLRDASEPLAAALFGEGKIALDTARSLRRTSHEGCEAERHVVSGPKNEAWEEAYRLFTAALRVDPSLSWARRYAEEARSHRLAARRSGPQP